MVLRSRTWIVPFLSIVPVHVGFESDAHAECDPEFRDFCAIRVDEGEPAPFSGQLLSDELAIALIQKAEDCDKECELKLARTSSVTNVLLDAAEKALILQRDAANQEGFVRGRSVGYEEGYKAASPSWYERPVVAVVLTAVTVVAGCMVLRMVDRSLERGTR